MTVAVPVTLSEVALIVDVCGGEVTVVTAVNKPLLSIVPALVFEEVQVALDVMSCFVPSDVVAVAVNCWVSPAFLVALVGATAIEVMFASETVTEVEPLMVPTAAVMVALPTEAPVTNPVLLTLATVESEVDQNALPVNDFVEPSL